MRWALFLDGQQAIAATASLTLTLTLPTVPFLKARILVSIFIASRIADQLTFLNLVTGLHQHLEDVARQRRILRFASPRRRRCCCTCYLPGHPAA